MSLNVLSSFSLSQFDSKFNCFSLHIFIVWSYLRSKNSNKVKFWQHFTVSTVTTSSRLSYRTLYSAVALSKALARSPLVPPPAQNQDVCFFCDIVWTGSFSTPAFFKNRISVAVLKFAATFSFKLSFALPERSFSTCSSINFEWDNKWLRPLPLEEQQGWRGKNLEVCTKDNDPGVTHGRLWRNWVHSQGINKEFWRSRRLRLAQRYRNEEGWIQYDWSPGRELVHWRM